MLQSEIYAAAMSCCWVSWGSGMIALMERWLVTESNSKVSTSSPWPVAKLLRLKNPVFGPVLSLCIGP